MRIAAIAAALLLAGGAVSAQRHELGTVNTETPEGQLLQAIGTEADAAKRAALLEQFAEKFPKHEAIAWVYEQMVPTYAKADQHDKALAAGDKLMAIDPADVENAHACLKVAEAKKDPALLVKWAAATSAAARKVAALPKPQNEDEAAEWKQRVDFAKQVDVYSEYALSAAVLQAADPKARIQLGEALERQNPNSKYFQQAAENLFRAYMQTNSGDKAVELAERVAEKDQSSPEMLLAAASGAMNKKQPDKVIALATKAMEVAEAKPKPDGVADADWGAWKTGIAGRGNWMIGMTHAAAGRYGAADKALRAALAGVANDPMMMSEALFQLGLANYKMADKDPERARDAVRFFEQCAKYPGRNQANARQNIKAIQTQYRVK